MNKDTLSIRLLPSEIAKLRVRAQGRNTSVSNIVREALYKQYEDKPVEQTKMPAPNNGATTLMRVSSGTHAAVRDASTGSGVNMRRIVDAAVERYLKVAEL